jgi:signal transduction histidine kinase
MPSRSVDAAVHHLARPPVRVAGRAAAWPSRLGRTLLCAALLFGTASPAAEAERPRSVLVLYGFDPFSPSVVAFDAALRSTLAAEGPPDVSINNEVLDPEAMVDPVLAPKQHAWFRERYGVFRPDVVVAAGSGALDFALGQRAELWPDVPILYTGVDEEVVARLHLPAGVTGIARRAATGETLKMALRLLPGTARVAFISGTGAVDRTYEAGVRPELARVTGHLEQIDLVGLSLPDLADRLAALPDDTFVLGVALARDGTGRSIRGSEAIRMLARRSRAPMFSTHSLLLGAGVVGGWVTDYSQLGHETGRLVATVLGLRGPAPLPAPSVLAPRPVVDWRQLERWQIPESRLSPGTEVLFRETSVWQRYRGTVAGVVGALLVESSLIAFLLLERRRRRAAESESRANQERIAHINRVGTIAELSGSLAHELNGPLGAVVNNARAARKFLLGPLPDLAEVRASLLDIESSAERASLVIKRLRTVLRKDHFRPGRVDAGSVVQDAVRLVQAEADRRRVTVELVLPPALPAVTGDDVLLLQVLLNLLLNALDAVAAQPTGQRRIAVHTAAHGNAVEISVSDSGTGLPAGALEGVFEPFFTTKPNGLGMGLTICRSIAEAHGGRIAAENLPGGGAVFRLTLPSVRLRQEAAA